MADSTTLHNPVADDPADIVRSTWEVQARWSRAADRLKADYDGWRLWAVVGILIGAVCETLAASLAEAGGQWEAARPWIAGLGAVVLAITTVVGRAKGTEEQVEKWVRARSASEGLKEHIYRFLVGAAPYGVHASPDTLVDARERIEKEVDDLGAEAADVVVIGRGRPETWLTAEQYVADRIEGQIEKYYSPKSASKATTARRLRDLLLVLGIIAAALGALASLPGAAPANGPQLAVLGPWVAVVTTIAAAVTTQLAAGRYDHDAQTFFATARRLANIRDRWRATGARKEQRDVVDQLVEDTETAISYEHQSWLAARRRTDNAE